MRCSLIFRILLHILYLWYVHCGHGQRCQSAFAFHVYLLENAAYRHNTLCPASDGHGLSVSRCLICRCLPCKVDCSAFALSFMLNRIVLRGLQLPQSWQITFRMYFVPHESKRCMYKHEKYHPLSPYIVYEMPRK